MEMGKCYKAGFLSPSLLPENQLLNIYQRTTGESLAIESLPCLLPGWLNLGQLFYLHSSIWRVGTFTTPAS